MANESAGEAAWKLSFQLSPIILSGGIVGNFLSGYLPIIAITEIVNFPAGLLSGMGGTLDSFFANFRPVAGTTILEQEIGHYPFANQGIAANAVIVQPLTIVMEMLCPAQTEFGYYEKLAVMEALTAALSLHTQLGGTYIVITPSQIYTNCLLKAIRDTSQGPTNQPQVSWQWEFEQPLLTISGLTGALNSLYSLISNQTQMPGTPLNAGIQSGIASSSSLGTAQGMPAAAQTAASTIASPPPTPPVTVPATPPPVTSLPPFQIPGLPQQ